MGELTAIEASGLEQLTDALQQLHDAGGVTVLVVPNESVIATEVTAMVRFAPVTSSVSRAAPF